jgi:hypothetical protein
MAHFFGKVSSELAEFLLSLEFAEFAIADCGLDVRSAGSDIIGADTCQLCVEVDGPPYWLTTVRCIVVFEL